MLPKAFDLVSTLPRDDCVRRLRANTENRRLLPQFSSKPTAGRVKDDSFLICKRIAHHNSFQPYLSGQLLDENGGTRLRCRLRMHPAVVGFMAIWFGVVLIGGGRLAISTIGSPLGGDPPADAGRGIVLCIFMLAFGAALVGFGRFAARDEPRFLVEFLRETIDAREA